MASDSASVVHDVAAHTSPSPQWTFDSSTFAAVAAAHVINALIEKGGDILYDHYLQSKEEDFVVARTVQSLKLLVEWHLPEVDGAQHRPAESHLHGSMSPITGTGNESVGAWECEPEPQPAPLDSWARSSIPTRVPLQRRWENLESRRSRQSGRAGADGNQQHASSSAMAGSEPDRRSSSTGQRGVVQAMELQPIAEATIPEEPDNNAASVAAARAIDAERRRILSEMERRKKDTEHAKRRENEESKEREARDKAFKKKLRGKAFTIDERGGVLLVTKPDPERLPPTIPPVDSQAVDLTALPVHLGGYGQPTDGSNTSRSPRTKTKPLLAGTTQLGEPEPSLGDRMQAIDSARGNKQFFREAVSSQPSLIDHVPSLPRGLAAGVSIREEGRVLAGPPPAEDPRHVTRTSFMKKAAMSGTGSLSSSMSGSMVLNGTISPNHTGPSPSPNASFFQPSASHSFSGSPSSYYPQYSPGSASTFGAGNQAVDDGFVNELAAASISSSDGGRGGGGGAPQLQARFAQYQQQHQPAQRQQQAQHAASWSPQRQGGGSFKARQDAQGSSPTASSSAAGTTASLLGQMYASLADPRRVNEVTSAAAAAVRSEHATAPVNAFFPTSAPLSLQARSAAATGVYTASSTTYPAGASSINGGSTMTTGTFVQYRPSSAPRSPDADMSNASRTGTRIISAVPATSVAPLQRGAFQPATAPAAGAWMTNQGSASGSPGWGEVAKKKSSGAARMRSTAQ